MSKNLEALIARQQSVLSGMNELAAGFLRDCVDELKHFGALRISLPERLEVILSSPDTRI